jgi:hypothetical protein
MNLLSLDSILIAHGAVRDASKRVATELRSTPRDTPLGFLEIAASVGIDLWTLPATGA